MQPLTQDDLIKDGLFHTDIVWDHPLWAAPLMLASNLLRAMIIKSVINSLNCTQIIMQCMIHKQNSCVGAVVVHYT